PHWTGLIGVGKVLFLAALAALWLGPRRRPGRDAARVALVVLLAFDVLYGAVSAQYLLWPVPFGALHPGRLMAAHAVAAAAALIAFYLFLAPGVLTAGPAIPAAGPVWVAGVAAALAVSSAWGIAEARTAA